VRFLVAVRGVQGQTISPEELFSRLSARWMWVEERKQPEKAEAQKIDDTNIKEVAVGMCVVESKSLADISAELVKLPGAGIMNIEVYPLAA
jgi:hypothetical protein